MDRRYFAAVTGVSLFVREMGPGQSTDVPLVVLHGGPDWDHSYLLPAVSLVAKRRRVLLVDFRGCGRSSRQLGVDAYQPELIVDDLIALIDRLRLDRVDLLGFSTGGQVAQLCLAAHPDRFRGVVLASTTAYPDVEQYVNGWAELAQRRRVVPPWPSWAGFTEGGATSNLERTIEWAIRAAPTNVWDLSRMDEYLTLLGRIRFSGEWMGALRSGDLHPWRQLDPEQVLRAFGGPVLILHGAMDMVFPLQVAERLAAAVPNAQLAVIDEAGHMAQFEQPHVWARHVLQFLER